MTTSCHSQVQPRDYEDEDKIFFNCAGRYMFSASASGDHIIVSVEHAVHQGLVVSQYETSIDVGPVNSMIAERQANHNTPSVYQY